MLNLVARSINWNSCFSSCSQRFPFVTNNPVGYLIAVILEYIVLGCEFFVISCTLALGIGGFCIAIAATNEIERILHRIDDKTQANEIQSDEIMFFFVEFVDIHGMAKPAKQLSTYFSILMRALWFCSNDHIDSFRLIHDSSDILQPVIMSFFTWSLLAISGSMLIIQMEVVEYHLNPIESFYASLYSLCTINF